MVYAPGLEDKRHERFCKQARSDLVEWRASKKDRALVEYDDGQVFVVDAGSERFAKLGKLLRTELGTCADDGAAARTMFAFVLDGAVVGCVVTERIAEAYESRADNVLHRASPKPARLGVAQMWVHSAHRRKGIAARLVDAARSHDAYPAAVPKSLVAFSQPTLFGALFASAYHKGKVLVYG